MVFKAEDIKLRKTVFSERWEIKRSQAQLLLRKLRSRGVGRRNSELPRGGLAGNLPRVLGSELVSVRT